MSRAQAVRATTQRSIATLHIGRHRADLVATIAAGVAVAVSVRWKGGRPKLSRVDAVRYRQVLTATAASLGVSGLIADGDGWRYSRPVTRGAGR